MKNFRSWKKCFQIFPFWVFFTSQKRHIFNFSCFFEKHDLKLRKLLCVKLWNKKIKRVIIWKKNVENISEFKKSEHSKNAFWNLLLRETTYFAFFVPFRKTRFEVRKFTMVRFCKNLYNLSDIEWNVWKRVEIWRKSTWEKWRYESCSSEKLTIFCNFPAFRKTWL